LRNRGEAERLPVCILLNRRGKKRGRKKGEERREGREDCTRVVARVGTFLRKNPRFMEKEKGREREGESCNVEKEEVISESRSSIQPSFQPKKEEGGERGGKKRKK